MLAQFLNGDGQLDAAEEAAYRAIDLATGEGNQYPVCWCYHLLGKIYHSNGENEKPQFEKVIGIQLA